MSGSSPRLSRTRHMPPRNPTSNPIPRVNVTPLVARTPCSTASDTKLIRTCLHLNAFDNSGLEGPKETVLSAKHPAPQTHISAQIRGMFFIFPLFRRWNEEMSMVFCQFLLPTKTHANAADSNEKAMPIISKHVIKFMQTLVLGSLVAEDGQGC